MGKYVCLEMKLNEAVLGCTAVCVIKLCEHFIYFWDHGLVKLYWNKFIYVQMWLYSSQLRDSWGCQSGRKIVKSWTWINLNSWDRWRCWWLGCVLYQGISDVSVLWVWYSWQYSVSKVLIHTVHWRTRRHDRLSVYGLLICSASWLNPW